MERPRFTVSAKKAKAPRYSREEWLSLALDVLARGGNAKLRVEAIAAALGVTTGSFYWHFKDRSDFLESLVRHWGVVTTDPVIEHVSGSPGDAKSRLYALLDIVFRMNLARYDVSVRAWAAQEPSIEPLVAEVDERRFGFVRSLLSEIGFQDQELEMRVRACIGYLILDPTVFDSTRDEKYRFEMLTLFHAVITKN